GRRRVARVDGRSAARVPHGRGSEVDVNADAILDAVRGVIRGELGSVRTVPAGAFGDGLPTRAPDDRARWLRSIAKPSFDVELPPPRASGAVGPSTANVAILAIEVLVTLTYTISHVAEVESADHRKRVRA